MKNITVKYDNIIKTASIPDGVDLEKDVIEQLNIEILQEKFKESLDLFSRTDGFNDTGVISTILSTIVWNFMYNNNEEVIIEEVK